jgi:murein DD-endopeptidase MepM/ murein hydrolase activator NlpD
MYAEQGPPLPPPEPPLHERALHLKRNSTLSQLLRSAGVDDAARWMAALQTATDLRKLRQSDTVHLFNTDSGELRKVVLDKSAWERAVVKSEGESLVAAMERDTTAVTAELMEIDVESNLYQALVDAAWDPQIAFELADVFAFDLDFYSDVQRGDRVLAWVDVRRRADGEFIQYGKLHGAIYAGRVGRFSAFRYSEQYYDEAGRSLRKEFLKSPLKYAHVTSHFGSRKHPVLGFTRQHAGTDFQASVGTPVWAVGDGKVTTAGWQGGYGKCVTVRHPNGLESLYAHLSQILVRVGQRVAQKTVIAASGNTGLSSGPHLHFGLKRGGAFMNPLSWKPVRVEPLAPSEVPTFREQIGEVSKRLMEALAKRPFAAR